MVSIKGSFVRPAPCIRGGRLQDQGRPANGIRMSWQLQTHNTNTDKSF